jgi:putative membrane protein
MRSFSHIGTKAALVVVCGGGMMISSALAQTQPQPNQGQQPASTSPYPSANDPLPGGISPEKSGTSGDTMSKAKAMQMDKRFLRDAVMSSMTEIEMGKLAAQKATNEQVKQYGQKMAQDHTRGLEYLRKTATRDGIEVAATMDAKHKDEVDKLAKLSGMEFDKAYVKYQVKHHERRVSDFQEESDNGSETAAKTLATRMLPAVQQHLNEAKDLNKALTATAMK